MELKVNDPKLIDAIFNGDAPDIYFAPDVDTLIAEKDALLNDFREMQRQLAEKCGRLEDAIDKKDDEIAELKQKLENVQASMYCDVVDANMENRRLKRALWLARALRARDIQRWWIAATCAPKTERACSVWNNVERKCRAKAEEYK